METFDALRLCAAYAEESGLEAVLTRKGEKDAPFDLLFLRTSSRRAGTKRPCPFPSTSRRAPTPSWTGWSTTSCT